MNYYVIETAESGVKYIKTKRALGNKEQATRETGYSVKWIAPVSFDTYLAIQLRRKILKKEI